MRTPSCVGVFVTAFAASISAHVMVSPPNSKSGATQRYEVRVHNEAKVAATSIDLDIPEGVTVTGVQQPSAGTYTTKTTGDRITMITWQVEVAPNRYLAMPFTAKNPDAATDLHWTVHEHLADGSVVNWSDAPGSQQKGSITKLTSGPE